MGIGLVRHMQSFLRSGDALLSVKPELRHVPGCMRMRNVSGAPDGSLGELKNVESI